MVSRNQHTTLGNTRGRSIYNTSCRSKSLFSPCQPLVGFFDQKQKKKQQLLLKPWERNNEISIIGDLGPAFPIQAVCLSTSGSQKERAHFRKKHIFLKKPILYSYVCCRLLRRLFCRDLLSPGAELTGTRGHCQWWPVTAVLWFSVVLICSAEVFSKLSLVRALTNIHTPRPFVFVVGFFVFCLFSHINFKRYIHLKALFSAILIGPEFLAISLQ